jgi:hypothetical protein
MRQNRQVTLGADFDSKEKLDHNPSPGAYKWNTEREFES